jgi:acetyl-CoA decarbonylase/synthase complex subunit delta
MPIDIPKDNWPGTVRTVTIGAIAADGGTRTSTITVGGQKNLPSYISRIKPNRPVVALKLKIAAPMIGPHCFWMPGEMLLMIQFNGVKPLKLLELT